MNTADPTHRYATEESNKLLHEKLIGLTYKHVVCRIKFPYILVIEWYI